MKCLRSLFTVLLLLCCTVTVKSHDFEVDGIYYNITDSTKKTVEVSYKGTQRYDYSDKYTGNVVIPRSVVYKGISYSIESIGTYAFYGCSGLTSITIPNSVTSIGDSAFYGCSGLTSITIPNSVTSIGDSAFYGCSGLTSITIPNSVTSIGNWAFYDCSGLKTVINYSSLIFSKDSSDNAYVARYADKVINAPNGAIVGDFVFSTVDGKHTLAEYLGNDADITLPDNYNGENYAIGDNLFKDNQTLTSIEIPNSVTSIGTYAFYGCSGLTSIEIPNSITSIGDFAFSDCSGLTNINVASGNTIYDSRNNCNAIIETASNTLIAGCKSTVIPGDVTSIGDGVFSGCSGLTSIEIPNSVTSIGDAAFADCSGLTSIEIPNSVTSIGDDAFYGCSGLTSITIPNSVTTIGNVAFFHCI